MAMTMPPGSVRDSLAHPAASSTSPMADGKIQTPFSEITSPGGLKCQEFGGRRGFEERQPVEPVRSAVCRRDPQAPGSSSLVFELALAP